MADDGKEREAELAVLRAAEDWLRVVLREEIFLDAHEQGLFDAVSRYSLIKRVKIPSVPPPTPFPGVRWDSDIFPQTRGRYDSDEPVTSPYTEKEARRVEDERRRSGEISAVQLPLELDLDDSGE